MHSIVVDTVSNMILVQISSKKELEQSFNFDGWVFFLSFTVFLWSYLNFFSIYLFACVMVHLDRRSK